QLPALNAHAGQHALTNGILHLRRLTLDLHWGKLCCAGYTRTAFAAPLCKALSAKQRWQRIVGILRFFLPESGILRQEIPE
ncbi:MAG: hypothetical protein ACRC4V_10065, partial [Aeromonas veronii]